jgi:glycine dehydrogenase
MTNDNTILEQLTHPDQFVHRHIGPDANDTREMLTVCGCNSLAEMVDAVVPRPIRLNRPLALPPARSEFEALNDLHAIAVQNQVFKSHIGMGYYDCITPPVIQRNILENPGWYTQYTPYQAEISQGRLEGLLNFQTMVCDLTGLEISNASLLDEATAAAEAMMLCVRTKEAEGRKVFLVSEDCHPQNIEVVRARAEALGVDVVLCKDEVVFDQTICGVLLQYPGTDGRIVDFGPLAAKAHAAGALVVVCADLLALTVLRPPGEFGADVAVGSAQRFGVPLGFGGPHAAFFATRDAYKRQMPGRLVGVSKDVRGRPALRLSLGTREQHIRREKATSNICTAQALLANMASAYAVYHGPEGLKKIARRIALLTTALASGLKRLGHEIGNGPWFDTVKIKLVKSNAEDVVKLAEQQRINLRVYDSSTVGVSLDETTSIADVQQLWLVFNGNQPVTFSVTDLAPAALETTWQVHARMSLYLTHPVFNRHHSETEMLRYLRRLESRDLSLCHSMIPLGSCTMKLNAAAEMLPVTWPEFSRIHPFAPASQTAGYQILFQQLEAWLAETTGFAAISLQPNAGSQGEYTGLLVIRKFHQSRGEGHRNICLIPQSAHGTNPASAVMAGFKVVPVVCDTSGNVDMTDLQSKAVQHAANLACVMVTYPSTHGVFEAGIKDLTRIVHKHGGQVYMDGANMNAQVGLCSPASIGADVCHLNLHKTFAIPHGGGGPGVGPIGVAKHLVNFLPGHSVVKLGGKEAIGAVSAAPWGSASILVIPWIYIAAMGPEGLTDATRYAILNANYISKRLEKYFPTLYRGNGGFVAHECILDLRGFKSVTAEDVAKRLMDYGFHAPTLSWPVAGTLMVEPTESEPKVELDRFCDAMIAIHAEMTAVETGQMDKQNNPLKNAPHTADMLTGDWQRPYTREQAAFPVKSLKDWKFWPAVGRVDNVFGDRNLVCSCAGMDAYGKE